MKSFHMTTISFTVCAECSTFMRATHRRPVRFIIFLLFNELFTLPFSLSRSIWLIDMKFVELAQCCMSIRLNWIEIIAYHKFIYANVIHASHAMMCMSVSTSDSACIYDNTIVIAWAVQIFEPFFDLLHRMPFSLSHKHTQTPPLPSVGRHCLSTSFECIRLACIVFAHFHVQHNSYTLIYISMNENESNNSWFLV